MSNHEGSTLYGVYEALSVSEQTTATPLESSHTTHNGTGYELFTCPACGYYSRNDN